MKILLTGATGYVGKRLLPILVENGHEVICCARDLNRFNPPESIQKKIKVKQKILPTIFNLKIEELIMNIV